MKGKGFGPMVSYVDMAAVSMDSSVKVIFACIHCEN